MDIRSSVSTIGGALFLITDDGYFLFPDVDAIVERANRFRHTRSAQISKHTSIAF